MEAVGEASAFHETAGEFVDEDDFAIADDVFAVACVDVFGANGVFDEVREFVVFAGFAVEGLDSEYSFGFFAADFGK